MVEFNFDHELEALGITLGVQTEIDPGEKGNINMAEPELAYPGSGPQVVRLSAYLNIRTAGYPEVDVRGLAVRVRGDKWQSLEEYLMDVALELYTENCD